MVLWKYLIIFPTSVGAKLCINTQLLRNRAYMHGYYSMCIFYFNNFWFAPFFFSLFFIYKTNPPSHVLSSSDTTRSHRHKINKKNQPLEQNRWIGVDGNRWWVEVDRFWWRSVMGWRRSVLMEIGVDGVLVMGWQRRGKKKILKKKKGEEREAEIEIRMVWRRGYSEEKEGYW